METIFHANVRRPSERVRQITTKTNNLNETYHTRDTMLDIQNRSPKPPNRLEIEQSAIRLTQWSTAKFHTTLINIIVEFVEGEMKKKFSTKFYNK